MSYRVWDMKIFQSLTHDYNKGTDMSSGILSQISSLTSQISQNGKN